MRQRDRNIESSPRAIGVGNAAQLSGLCALCGGIYAKSCICALLYICVSPAISLAQGSIFGNVKNADLSTPANGAVSFFGFINSSDAEIRTDYSIGAGYDNGNWFDDFQNYLSESAGQPYDYFFSNKVGDEGAQLSGSIPNNSFQQENISLSVLPWPSEPTDLQITSKSASAVSLRWDYDNTLTYHIYRRPTTSAGSFFRIDDTTGSLINEGIADSVFVDSDITGDADYNYIIIAENSAGIYSPHSELSTLANLSCCVLAGDANQDGKRNIADITFCVAYIFKGGLAPGCRDQADANSDNRVNIADVTYLVSWVFIGGPAPVCGSTGLIKSFNTNDSFTGSL